MSNQFILFLKLNRIHGAKITNRLLNLKGQNTDMTTLEADKNLDTDLGQAQQRVRIKPVNEILATIPLDIKIFSGHVVTNCQFPVYFVAHNNTQQSALFPYQCSFLDIFTSRKMQFVT